MGFWEGVDKRGPDDCWPWSRTIKDGYGDYIHKVNGKRVHERAHRVALMRTRPFPKHLSVLHSCDNPICCNPAHLRAGTHKDNMRDMVERGRQAHNHNMRNGRAVYSDETIALIRQRRHGGSSLREIVKEFGVSMSHASEVCSGIKRKNPDRSIF